MKRIRTLALFGMLAVIALAAPAFAATHSVSVIDNDYSPGTITVAVGDTVTWTNNGSAPHTVTANDGSFDSDPDCPDNFDACMQPGDTYSHTFNSAGTFGYFCKVHGQSMAGTVVVEGSDDGGGGGTPAPSPTGGELPETGSLSLTVPLLVLGALLVVGGVSLRYVLRKRV